MLVSTAEKKICPFIPNHGNCTPEACMSWKYNKYNSKDEQGKFASGYCILAKEKES